MFEFCARKKGEKATGWVLNGFESTAISYNYRLYVGIPYTACK